MVAFARVYATAKGRIYAKFLTAFFFLVAPQLPLSILGVDASLQVAAFARLFGAALVLKALLHIYMLKETASRRPLLYAMSAFEALVAAILLGAVLEGAVGKAAVPLCALFFALEALFDGMAALRTVPETPPLAVSWPPPPAPELVHWHAVLTADELADAPRGVTLCGHAVVLFRDEEGKVAALPDRCPHRGTRLSRGRVCGGKIVCPYHGWSFDRAGQGQVPWSLKLKPELTSYEASEHQGLVWIRQRGSASCLPIWDTRGMVLVGLRSYHIRAPLEAVLDNFSEVEHHGHVHGPFGFAPAQSEGQGEGEGALETSVEVDADEVRVENRGPQKPVAPWVRLLFRVRGGDRFINDWRIRFSPVHGIYEQRWEDESGGPRGDHTRYIVMFSPETARTTQVFVQAWIHEPAVRWPGALCIIRPVLLGMLDHEVQRDKRIVEMLTDPGAPLRGRVLGSFDRALVHNRRRLAQIYRGSATEVDGQEMPA